MSDTIAATRKALHAAEIDFYAARRGVDADALSAAVTELEGAQRAYLDALESQPATPQPRRATHDIVLDGDDVDAAEARATERDRDPRKEAFASIERERWSLDALRNLDRRKAIDAERDELVARYAVLDATDAERPAAEAAHERAVRAWHAAKEAADDTATWLRDQDHSALGRAVKAVAKVARAAREWAVGSVVLQRASDIVPLRAAWLQVGRIPLGELTLVAGGEGTGKSTYLYDVAARITRGQLDGEFHGTPKSVLVAATEDAWAQTIVPRLIAAGADLERILRVETSNRDGLSFPRDNDSLGDIARAEDVALLIVDPLTSRLGSADTHKDSDVRKALEPLVAVAHDNQFAIAAIIHLNKNENLKNITNQILGSKAFSAVARSILAVFPDPMDETGERKQVGLIKCNLTRLEADQPDVFRVESRAVRVFDPYTREPCETSVGGIGYLGKSDVTMKEASNPEAYAERRDGEEQVRALIDAIQDNGGALTPGMAKRILTDQFDMTVRTAERRISDAVRAGRIVSNGSTSSRTYTLPAG